MVIHSENLCRNLTVRILSKHVLFLFYFFRLVDSRDIMELKLKHMDCELIIRKKEAFAQPTTAAPVAMIQPPQQHVLPPQPPMPQPTPSAATPSASTPPLPSSSKGSQSSFPPLKCPMAGTFYRSPAPGEPPFVKV